MIIRKTQQGHIAMIAMVITLASLALSLGYLRWVMGERVSFLRRLAVERARLNSYDGLGRYGHQIAVDPAFGADSTLVNLPVSPYMDGLIDSIIVEMKMNQVSNRANHVATSVGSSFYPSFTGEYVWVRAKTYTAFQAKGFEEFMYFTNREEAGGGPYTFTSPTTRSLVKFGASDELEGRVHSNGTITMSSAGCPVFASGSEVTTAEIFAMAGCNENSVFPPDSVVHTDSVPKIKWPPFIGLEKVRQNADFFYDSSIKIHPGDLVMRDTLMMTEITFNEWGGFTVKRWPYIIPPDTVAANVTNLMKMYHPTIPNFFYSYAGHYTFHAFDFDRGMDGFIADSLVTLQTYSDPRAVIYVDRGQVIVKGTVRGQYTVATSGKSYYRLHHTNGQLDTLYSNIWITDDIVYADSYSTGEIATGSRNRLGLLSGCNVIIANTRANGGGNLGASGGIKINAAIIAMDESFAVQYWQNTTATRSTFPSGDGRGVLRMGIPGSTNALDMRGDINLWGSVVQSYRGYVRRNSSSTLGAYDGVDIGYFKNYHYDYNLLEYPPPFWPETQTENGESLLQMASYGEVAY